MALDGFAVACLRHELINELKDGYISKIAQPENDELLFTIKAKGENKRLLISASPSLPLVHLTGNSKPSPMSAPNFCMLLRKHIGGGRILDIMQPSLERVLYFIIEHRNEMGDLCKKKLIVELMGKHSNIIFTDENDIILDAIRRIPSHISSVREVLPMRTYFIPETTKKLDPLNTDEEAFKKAVFTKHDNLSKALYTSVTGFSPSMAEELLFRAGVDVRLSAVTCDEKEAVHIYHCFERMIDEVKNHEFEPQIFYENNAPKDFSVLHSERYSSDCKKIYKSISSMLEDFYVKKEAVSRIRQKSADLRKIVSTALERNVKKLSLQEKQLNDTKKKDKYKIYGELLNTYGYECKTGDKYLKAADYYSGDVITIPLDPLLSASENAKKYFDKYTKLKRTATACADQIEETKVDIMHLESIQTSLEMALDEEDLTQIKQELTDAGYIKKHTIGKKERSQKKSKPLHFISSDGFDIYVGKNNYQNDELTFHMATGGDWWFHAKQIPGSHVIVKADGKEVPDRTFEEAASAAAYYSKNRTSDKVEIDYTLKKNIKKPNKAKPGFVIYYTNYSMVAKPCIDSLTMI